MNIPNEPRVAIVTGATAGIGLHIAIGLARAGNRVVMLGRRRDHARTALARVARAVPGSQVQVVLADLADLDQVEQIGRQLRAEFAAVHVFIANAGAFFLTRQESPQGVEKTFAINHLGHFYLTHFLLDRLRAAPDARLIVTSSGAHRSAGSRELDWQSRRGYLGWQVYGKTKLANILFVRELARRYADRDLSIGAYHPGFVKTKLVMRNPLLRPFVWLAYLFVGGSAEQGAATGLYLALDDSAQGKSGGYYVDRQRVRPSTLARDEELAAELWDLSLDLAGISEYGQVD